MTNTELYELDPILADDVKRLPSELHEVIDTGANPYEVVNVYQDNIFSVEDIVSAWDQFSYTQSFETAIDEYMWKSN